MYLLYYWQVFENKSIIRNCYKFRQLSPARTTISRIISKLYWCSQRTQGLASLPFILLLPFKACLAFSPEHNFVLRSTEAALPTIHSILHSSFKPSFQKPNAQADTSPMKPEFLRLGLRHQSLSKLLLGFQWAARVENHWLFHLLSAKVICSCEIHG